MTKDSNDERVRHLPMGPERYEKYACAEKDRAARDPAFYNQLWTVTQRAAELFKQDHPNGHMPTPLPQFRRSYPDPQRLHYEGLAWQELRQQDRERGPRR